MVAEDPDKPETGTLVEENDRQDADSSPFRRTGLLKFLTVLGFAVTIGIYILRVDQAVGLNIDDGWYVLLAKVLAQGDGYTLVNSPSPGILPLYPPGFPFVLSIFYRLSPRFPENLWLLKSVSIVSMIAAGYLTIVYLRRYRGDRPLIALGLGLATMLCAPLAFLATSTMMSECFFTLLLISTILVIERSVDLFSEQRAGTLSAWLLLLAGAALAAYAFLTRSIAVALIGAAFLYLVSRRLFRQAAVFAVAVMLVAGPWVVYSRIHAPTAEEQMEQGGHIVQPYTKQFWQRVASIENSDTITVADLPSRVWNNVLEIAGLDALHITAAPVYESLRDPVEEARRLATQGYTDKTEGTFVLSYLIALLMLAGFVRAARERIGLAEIAIPMLMVITVFWPWETVRFMLPLTPLLFYYLARGGEALGALIGRFGPRKAGPALSAVIVVLLLAVNLYGHQTYLSRKLSESALDKPVWLQAFIDAEALLGWVDRSIPKDETLVTLNPPLVYLYTGRKSVAWGQPEVKWELWKRLGIRHLVWFSAYPMIPEPQQQKYQTVYRQQNPMDYRVVDLGPPDKRVPW